jgi:hypothetical protein
MASASAPPAAKPDPLVVDRRQPSEQARALEPDALEAVDAAADGWRRDGHQRSDSR